VLLFDGNTGHGRITGMACIDGMLAMACDESVSFRAMHGRWEPVHVTHAPSTHLTFAVVNICGRAALVSGGNGHLAEWTDYSALHTWNFPVEHEGRCITALADLGEGRLLVARFGYMDVWMFTYRPTGWVCLQSIQNEVGFHSSKVVGASAIPNGAATVCSHGRVTFWTWVESSTLVFSHHKITCGISLALSSDPALLLFSGGNAIIRAVATDRWEEKYRLVAHGGHDGAVYALVVMDM